MRSNYEHHGLKWVDLESPTRDEVRTLMKEYNLPPLIADEILTPIAKSRIELHPGFVYIVMHFPSLKRNHASSEQELDFIVGRDFIITARYETIDPLHHFSKVFEANSMLDSTTIGEHAGFVFFFMLKRLYKSVEHIIEHVRGDLRDIDKHIFAGEERAMVEAISRSARELLSLRQAIEPHREILHELEQTGGHFFGEDFTQYLRALSNDYYRVHNHIMRETETLRELRETNDSLLSTKQNEVMKILTVITVITAPLALAAAIFGMSAPQTPLIDIGGKFWVILGAMLTAAFAMFMVFKRKRWL